ncbi:blue light receptor [Thoreauomyces humboldtii]|nr:blue light receptor [Thoreauomyces humboldtii]
MNSEERPTSTVTELSTSDSLNTELKKSRDDHDAYQGLSALMTSSPLGFDWKAQNQPPHRPLQAQRITADSSGANSSGASSDGTMRNQAVSSSASSPSGFVAPTFTVDDPLPPVPTPRDLIASSPDFVHILSSRGIILFASAACTSLLNWKPTDLVGRLITEFSHPADTVGLMRELKTATAGPVDAAYRFRTGNRDGRYLYIEASGHRFEMNNRKKTRCVVLTGRERVVGDLKQSVLIPTTLNPSARDLWARVTTSGLLLHVSRNASPVFGTLASVASLHGRSFLDFVYEGDRARVARRLFSATRHAGDEVAIVKCSVECGGRFVGASVEAHPGGGLHAGFLFLRVALLGRWKIGGEIWGEGDVGLLEDSGATDGDGVFDAANGESDRSVQYEVNRLRLGNKRLREEIELLSKIPKTRSPVCDSS